MFLRWISSAVSIVCICRAPFFSCLNTHSHQRIDSGAAPNWTIRDCQGKVGANARRTYVCTAAYVIVYLPIPVSSFVTLWHQMALHGRIWGSRIYLGGGKQAPIVSTGAKDSNPPNRKERIVDSATMNAMVTYIEAKTYNVRRAVDEKLGAVISTEMIILIGLLALALVFVLSKYSGHLVDVIEKADNVVSKIGTSRYPTA